MSDEGGGEKRMLFGHKKVLGPEKGLTGLCLDKPKDTHICLSPTRCRSLWAYSYQCSVPGGKEYGAVGVYEPTHVGEKPGALDAGSKQESLRLGLD